MSGLRYEVPSRKRKEIRAIAHQVREGLGLRSGAFPIIHVLEWILPETFPGYVFSVGDPLEMGNDHGMTIPSEHQIILREDVYLQAIEGRGRDRLTAAHELGHYLLHQNIAVTLARSDAMPPAYKDSEWQANCFAGELLIPSYELITCSSLQEVCERFEVSKEAAANQNKALNKEGSMRILSW